MKAPVLGLYGEADQGIPVTQVEAMKAALQAAGKKTEFQIYPGAPHGFHADYRPSYRKDAADDAWNRRRPGSRPMAFWLPDDRAEPGDNRLGHDCSPSRVRSPACGCPGELRLRLDQHDAGQDEHGAGDLGHRQRLAQEDEGERRAEHRHQVDEWPARLGPSAATPCDQNRKLTTEANRAT